MVATEVGSPPTRNARGTSPDALGPLQLSVEPVCLLLIVFVLCLLCGLYGYLRTRACLLLSVGTNLSETTLEADSHGDTTVLGGTLELFEYDCPVNVQRYDLSLGT